MNNQTFNRLVKRAFNRFAQDAELIDEISRIWFYYETSREQDELLEEIKQDATKGLASCAERYLLTENRGE